MIDRRRIPRWITPVVYLSNNVISLIGVIMTTTGGVAWLFLLPVYLGQGTEHPYMGILFYMVVPAFFFTGLVMMPLGILWRKRREHLGKLDPGDFPPINWENAAFRRLVYFIGIATVVNVVIAGNLTTAGIEYMDSTTFCGLTCHTVMIPEYTAYQDSPHFRVKCTDCHIGAGASWFVRSKVSGVRQVIAVALNTYSRPIPTPIHNLRPARETCEQCHWPQKFSGSRLVVETHYADDAKNTMTKNVLMMHIGGGGGDRGIHGFHLDPGVVVQYRSNEARDKIPWVSYTDTKGVTTVYATKDWDPAKADQYELRTMDCIDCHNRPTHAYDLPNRAMDRAMAKGLIDASLPFVKKTGLAILKVKYASRAEAEQEIPARLEAYYQKTYPQISQSRSGDIRSAAEQLLHIYQRNVFPEMKVTWGTYPNWLGHTDFIGCWRCHDDEHESKSGKSITQDCSACHEILAMDEANPEILSQLGISTTAQ